MNIKEAKEQIKNAVTAYFSKDQFGNYEIPIEKQRPIFLMGAPGIGKTAVMEQVAQELGVGLVSYSMTHHTRQSALGLPFIVKKNYGGKEYDVSEYTMSEIIASVYDMMEDTGVKEGILFLDEINCVSETLAPSMLQFLQYKVFGRHRVPDGWIVVTAGNPPQYNKSVREFDIVTWDRLKRVDIEPDFDAWKEYAYKKRVHASVLTYLEIKKNHFYKVETTVNGKSFITARGWDDLSQMIKIYEKHGIKVDENLIGQYVQNKAIARDFALYYDLYNKYKSDYQIDDILGGTAPESIKERAKNAKFDERMALLGLILDRITDKMTSVTENESMLMRLMEVIKEMSAGFKAEEKRGEEILTDEIIKQQTLLAAGRKSSSLSYSGQVIAEKIISFINNVKKEIVCADTSLNNTEAFNLLKLKFKGEADALKAEAKATGEKLSNVFRFCEEVFGDGQEMLILVTELTTSYYGSKFISRYGCEEYFKHNKELLFYERQKDIIVKMEELEIN